MAKQASGEAVLSAIKVTLGFYPLRRG